MLIVSTIVYRLCEGVSDFQGGRIKLFCTQQHKTLTETQQVLISLQTYNQAVFLYKLINQEMGVSPPPFFSRSKKKDKSCNSEF